MEEKKYEAPAAEELDTSVYVGGGNVDSGTGDAF